MRTIRRSLTRKLLVLVCVPVVLGGVGIWLLLKDETVEQFDAAVVARASATAALVMEGPSGVRIGPPIVFFDADVEGDEVAADVVYEMFAENGSSVASSAMLSPGTLAASGTSQVPGQCVDLRMADGRTFRMTTVPVSIGQRRLTLALAMDRSELDATLRNIALVLSVTGVALLTVTMVAVPVVVGREFAPIDRFAGDVSRISADSLDMRLPTNGLAGELVPIATQVNELLSRLQSSFQRERQFSADLAHELRTPLAELRSLAEVALKWPDARPAETDRDVLDSALQMERLISRLLALVRTDAGQTTLTLEMVDVGEMLRELWSERQPRADDRRIVVEWEIAHPVMCRTDPVLCRAVITNLLENALEHSPVGSVVSITADSDPHRWCVSVCNPAPHLNADNILHVFDRFWRADESRTDATHLGLGLPLARSFVRVLGGSLTARLDDDGRIVVTLTVPIEGGLL